MRKISLLALAIAVVGCATTPARPEPVVRELEVTDMTGKVHDLGADLSAGRTVALVFWQAWCLACAEEAPRLAYAARTHEDIRFIGIVPGPNDRVDESEVQSFVGRFGLSYPQVRDHDLVISDRFAVKGTPTTIVLGPGGRVVYRGYELPSDWRALQRIGNDR